MRTAEEILSDFGIEKNDYQEGSTEYSAMLQAMETYAREVADAQSLEFAKWMEELAFAYKGDGIWLDFFSGVELTDSQLIQKYHEQRKGN